MNERKWHEWNSTFPQWKEKIVEIELVRSHFPSHILKVSVLLLPPLFLPSSLLPACVRFRTCGGWKKKNRVTSFTGYQLGSFSDVLQRNQWLASAASDRKVACTPEADFSRSPVVRLLSEVALILCGGMAHGGHGSSRALLLNFCSISRDCTIFHPLSHIISGGSPSVSSTLCS